MAVAELEAVHPGRPWSIGLGTRAAIATVLMMVITDIAILASPAAEIAYKAF